MRRFDVGQLHSAVQGLGWGVSVLHRIGLVNGDGASLPRAWVLPCGRWLRTVVLCTQDVVSEDLWGLGSLGAGQGLPGAGGQFLTL